MTGIVIGGFALLLTAYLGATAYLIYRDDLLGNAVTRQVEMQYVYEERIAALRSELDRLSSRHLVQTENVETQLGVLLERQADIHQRQSSLEEIVDRARSVGIQATVEATRLPRARPAGVRAEGEPLAYAPSAAEVDHMITGTLLRGSDESDAPTGAIRPALKAMHSELERAGEQQSEILNALSAKAQAEASRLTEALTPIGVDVGGPEDDEPQGGPYIPAAGMHFVERTAILSRMLDDVETLRRNAEAMPTGAPVRATRVSARFGDRIDPFLRQPAFHAGLDLAAAEGSDVRATAAGTVVSAGWEGGYGKMVEIRHRDGLSTRYGHLSAILVSPEADVVAGALIGRVGSTGRSTGPHLHYETRRAGKPVNPAPFLAAGRALREGAEIPY